MAMGLERMLELVVHSWPNVLFSSAKSQSSDCHHDKIEATYDENVIIQ
jgi:hypothetical protein